jgi:MOSC domain-containing protein YiiM
MAASAVEAIFIHGPEGGPMAPVREVRARAGAGLEEDRYFNPEGVEPDTEITLIESEAIEAFVRECEIPLDQAESRRNVVTRGVPLNDLVGREFSVGPVRLKGIRLCEPCAHLQKLTRPGVLRGLVHRGGLRAEILVGGPIRVGDPVVTS